MVAVRQLPSHLAAYAMVASAAGISSHDGLRTSHRFHARRPRVSTGGTVAYATRSAAEIVRR